MEYYSTNDHTLRVSLRQAVITGMSADGGLYMPVDIPRLPHAFFNNIAGLSLHDIAYVAAHTLFHGDLTGSELKKIVASSLNFDIPLKQLDDNIHALELFHGPTMTVKDIGTRFMARLIASPHNRGERVNVLVATSGDTGGAVAGGFHGVPGVDVWVLYPIGTLDRYAESQFTSLGGNIHPIAVNAGIDECRAMVKAVLMDGETAHRYNLVTANSINVARLLPQTFYYFHAYARLQELHPGVEPPVIAVPAGNLGNLTAGVIAARMGLPVKRFIAVNNHNDVFVDFLEKGRMNSRQPLRSLAEAIDVGNPSNFPRLVELFKGDLEAMNRMIGGASVNDDEISATINRYLDTKDYLMDPHSAAACHALETSLQPGETGIFQATAHPAKFRNAVETVTGKRMEIPRRYMKYVDSPRRSDRIAPHADALRRYLVGKIKPTR